MANPNNFGIIVTITIISIIIGFFLSLLTRLASNTIKISMIVIGIILVSMSSYKLYLLNQSQDGFLGIGIAMETFIFGILGGGLLFSILLTFL